MRISFDRKPFQRAYQEQYTTEVFKVVSRMRKIPMNKLSDLKGDGIKGSFYTAELQKVNKDENALWFIERILKKRKRNKNFNTLLNGKGFPKHLIAG